MFFHPPLHDYFVEIGTLSKEHTAIHDISIHTMQITYFLAFLLNQFIVGKRRLVVLIVQEPISDFPSFSVGRREEWIAWLSKVSYCKSSDWIGHVLNDFGCFLVLIFIWFIIMHQYSLFTKALVAFSTLQGPFNFIDIKIDTQSEDETREKWFKKKAYFLIHYIVEKWFLKLLFALGKPFLKLWKLYFVNKGL